MRDRNRQDWYARLRAWWERTEKTLRSKWWLWPILLIVDLFWHSVHVRILHALEARSGGVSEALHSLVTVLTPIGLATTLSLLIVLGFAIHAYFDVKKLPSHRNALDLPDEAPTIAELRLPALEPLAPSEVVEQLRTFYHFLARAVQWAADFLDAGICGAANSEGPKAAMSQLIRELLLPACRDNKEHLDGLVTSGDWTESRLAEVAGRSRTLLNGDYRRLTAWITRAGEEILGKQALVSAPGYIELRHRHWELFEEARRIRTHSRLGGIVPTFDIGGFLPGLARQEPMTDLRDMSVQELCAHVRNEGVTEFIGLEWSPERLTIAERRTDDQRKALDLSCRTDSGYVVLLLGLQPGELDRLLRPGRRISVWGTIKEVTKEHVLLSPAELLNAESDH